MMTDLRHALRQLAKSPGFTSVVILSLSLGIGAATSVFSVVNAVLLRALPVKAPQELRLINWIGLNPKLNNYTGNGTSKTKAGYTVGSSFPYPILSEFQNQSAGLASIFAFSPLNRITAFARGEAAVTSGIMVTGNFFSEYGVSSLMGRLLTLEDDHPGAAPVAVITYGMWERRFGLDPHAIGQTLTINQSAFTVIGILPRDYMGPMPGDMAECYVTFAAQPLLAANRPLNSMNQWWVQVMARLAPDADENKLQAALTMPLVHVLGSSTTKIEQPRIVLENGAQGAGTLMRTKIAKPLLLLLAAVGIILAIACANVAGLQLARGATRQHEFAVRAALGASRWRLVRQSITESLLLGLAAGSGGLLLGNWGKSVLLPSLGALPDSFRLDLRPDFTVLAFALSVSVLTALVFGLLPALRAARVDPLTDMKGHSSLAAPRQRIGKILVVIQVGLSVLLVVGAGLMVRTFSNLARVEPGFNPENILLFRVDPGRGAGYKGAATGRFYTEARRSLEAIPGVRSVALTSTMLVSDSSSFDSIEIAGPQTESSEKFQMCIMVVSDGFFGTLGIPVLQGREFSPSDTATSPLVAVVNETFVKTILHGENPLGRTFNLVGSPNRVFTIIGVNRDTKQASIREKTPPVVSFCYLQGPYEPYQAPRFVIRSALPPTSLVPAARQAIANINRNIPLSDIRTQEQLVSQSVSLDRLFAGLCSGLAALALLLACIGLYGLIAYNVTQRTREFGIRMALGATQLNIAWPILRGSFLLVGTGFAAGFPAAIVLTRFVKSRLYGITPFDPLSFFGGAFLLIAVAALAAWLPARRAIRLNPVEALRAE